MPRKVSQNIEMLGIVATGLKGLKQKVVFVGGATVDLFVIDPAAPATRATEDVDCVVEIVKRTSYYALEEELRALGFTNRWYPDGMANAKVVDLPNGERVSVFSAPYLLASKLEAFRGRGKGDFLASKDFEDIVALIDGAYQRTRPSKGMKSRVNQFDASLVFVSAHQDILKLLVRILAVYTSPAHGGRPLA